MNKICTWFWLIVCIAGTNVVHSQARETALPHLSFSDTTLGNGLRVIIVPDHSAPVCAISVTYNVGSRNEQPGTYRVCALIRAHDVSRFTKCWKGRALHLDLQQWRRFQRHNQ